MLGCCLVLLQLRHSWGPPGLLLLSQLRVLLQQQQRAWSLPSQSARPELMLAWLPSLQALQQLERGSLWVQLLLVMVCMLLAGLLQEQHQLLARVSSQVPWPQSWHPRR